MTKAEQIDDLFDFWEIHHPGFEEFTADEVGNSLGIDRPTASVWLSLHRRAQGKGRTRWIVNCRENGPSAYWYVMAGPSRPAGAGERLTLGHAAHVANDLRKRAMSDLTNELRPAAAAHPAIQALVAGSAKQIEGTVLNLVDSINVVLDTIEATTGVVADRRSIA